MAEGISIQLTHTGLSGSSIFIDDIREGQDRTALNRKAGPNYVPVNGVIELAYSGLVSISFESGSIRKFIDGGYLTAVFLLSPAFIAALPPLPPAAHAPTHERTGTDPIDGDHLDIDFVPANYVRDDTIPEADALQDLAAHLKGIDNAFGAAVAGTPAVVNLARGTNVPSGIPILYLANGNVVTSAAPLAVRAAGTLVGATICVDVADAARTFTLRVLVNGVVQENLVLPSGSNSAVTSGFSTALVSGDKISAYLERTAGPLAKSDFDQISVLIYFTE